VKTLKQQIVKALLPGIILLLFHMQLYAQSDTPCNAPFLAVNTDTCGFFLSTTIGATYQNDVLNGGTPPCASPGAPDVWYRIIIPASGAVAITTSQGSITDGGLAVYSGSCNNLNFISCNDDGAGNMMPVIDRSDFVPGDTLYIRFWKGWGNGTGTFHLCVIESHSDCISASFVCGDKHFPKCTYGPGSHFDAYAGNNCGMTEYQSQWLTFNFLTSGTFQFTIFPDSLNGGYYPDYDWMMFQDNNPAYCSVYDSSYAPLVCNASSTQGPMGSTGLDISGVSNSVPAGPGNAFCPIMNVNAGQVYYMFINNFSLTSTGYFITFGGTAIMNCNQTTGIEPMEALPLFLNIFPDPVINTMNVQAGVGAEIDIYDMEGQIAKRIRMANSSSIIDVSDLHAGIYLIKATTENEIAVKKFLKE